MKSTNASSSSKAAGAKKKPAPAKAPAKNESNFHYAITEPWECARCNHLNTFTKS